MGNSLDSVFENETWFSDGGPCAVFDITPFASGQRLVAFKGVITQPMARSHVIKVFREKTGHAWDSSYRRCLSYLESRNMTQKYLEDFGENMLSFLDLRSAEMDRVSLFTSQILTSDKCHKRRLCEDDVVVFEQDLGKNFKTFIERDGTVSSNCCGKLQEFVHFVYNESKGQEIVTGLKGVRVGQNFKLTSPSMNSVSKKYGPDDFGEEAMLNFFDSHTCTDVCAQWPKPIILHPFPCLETFNKTHDEVTATTDNGMFNGDMPPEYNPKWRIDFENSFCRQEPSAPPAYDNVT
ncbi:uncharacterized protein LOC132549443 [Ylistrum balloti]|uniref:uncharacterized protein LOC132549443 n=1 Tax=Ylistrum balloti TaxID=509963 RepID=UPI002905A5FC|nr:uncharacterized protein LOC132549443 [Ylistrum balloti]